MNPYAYHLTGQVPARPVEEVLTATPGLLHELACALTPEQLEAPLAPGKWSPRQVLAHYADCELAFSWRLRQILAEENPTLQPFDQDVWAAHYAAYTVPAALGFFRTGREWNLALLRTVSPADRTRPGFHPERGPITFQTTLETMAGHDLHHLKQLQTLTA